MVGFTALSAQMQPIELVNLFIKTIGDAYRVAAGLPLPRSDHAEAIAVWGDAINTASRMASQGEPDGIQVTEATYARLKNTYVLEDRGAIAPTNLC